MWVWVLAFTILGSKPEHGSMPKFSTKIECEKALLDLKEREKAKGRELVGRCSYGQISKG